MIKRLFALLSLSCLVGCGAKHTTTLVTLDAAVPTPAPAVASAVPPASDTAAIASQTAALAEKATAAASQTATASGTPSASPSPIFLPPLPPDSGQPPDYPWPGDRATCETILGLQEARDIDPSLTTSSALVVHDLLDMGVAQIDIWYGSHLVIKGDHGSYYQRWTAKPQDVMPRTSSHVSSVQQYQIEVGFRDNGILMGETPDGDTWVQLERHAYHSTSTNPIGKLIGIISNIDSAHGQDYFIYRRTHENVGPLGLSPYTDTNPLVIDAPGTTDTTSPAP